MELQIGLTAGCREGSGCIETLNQLWLCSSDLRLWFCRCVLAGSWSRRAGGWKCRLCSTLPSSRKHAHRHHKTDSDSCKQLTALMHKHSGAVSFPMQSSSLHSSTATRAPWHVPLLRTYLLDPELPPSFATSLLTGRRLPVTCSLSACVSVHHQLHWRGYRSQRKEFPTLPPYSVGSADRLNSFSARQSCSVHMPWKLQWQSRHRECNIKMRTSATDLCRCAAQGRS